MGKTYVFLKMQAFSAFVIFFLVAYAPISYAQQQDTLILYDPGPDHFCYDYIDITTSSSPTYSDISQCQAIGVPADPAWTFSWFNPEQSFNGFSSGGNGQPINVKLINNAEGWGNCDSAVEPTLKYDYPGYAIKKLNQNTGQQYDLSQFDQWIVEYDVTVQPDNTACPNCPGCNGYNRKYLTTDFIYYWSECDGCTANKNVISIVHYNPIQTHAWLGPFNESDGYRIQINGPPTLVEGQTAHVALDFKELLLKYSTELCHGGGMPYYPTLYSLQIVSSNVNASSTIDIENVQLTLRNNPDNTTPYPTPTYPAGSTPAYCPSQAPPPADSACHVEYNITSQWSTGYTVDVHLTNEGSSTISSWTLNWDLAAQQTVSGDGWDASVTQTGQAVSASNLASNGNLAPQNVVDFGFNVDATSSPNIPPITMNGVSCTVN